MQGKDIILEVKKLNTTFTSDKKVIRIVKDVSFCVTRGSTLAVVGESGCGKSVTMNSVMRFLGRNANVQAECIAFHERCADGTVKTHRLEGIEKANSAQIRALRGPQMSMVFQDPMSSLNPVYKVGDQVAEGLIHHTGMSKKEARGKVLELFRNLGIPDPESRMDCYPHQFSGGMKQRVVIAIAMICNPDLIICDEPTTALDVTIQAQIMELLKQLQTQHGKSIILITHNMGLVAEMADEVCVMYMGRVVEFGTLVDIFDHPSHPYTKALLRSVPVLGLAEGKQLETIAGITPNPADVMLGCEFADRCTQCTEKCRCGDIPMYEISAGHRVRCVQFDAFEEVD